MNPTTEFSNPWCQAQKILLDEASAALGRMTNLPTLWQRAQTIRKGVSPATVVYEEDRLKLRHYLSAEKPRFRTPVVFIYALVNRPYILDLKKGRSVVANFVERGFDTRSEEHTSELQSLRHLVCRLLLEKKNH